MHGTSLLRNNNFLVQFVKECQYWLTHYPLYLISQSSTNCLVAGKRCTPTKTNNGSKSQGKPRNRKDKKSSKNTQKECVRF